MTLKLASVLATVFGAGYLPFAPGTFGTLVGVLLSIISVYFLGSTLIPSFFVFFIGVWASSRMATQRGLEDPQEVVIDEVCGVMIAYWGVVLNWGALIAGFILFRLFDILKPPPIRQCERFPKGWGIMMDDVAAGLAAQVVMRVGVYYGFW